MGKKISEWLARPSQIFSLMSGEDVTNGEVVAVHAGIVVALLACGLAEWLAR